MSTLPLLLMDRPSVEDIELQVCGQRCDRSAWDTIFACVVDAWGIESMSLPDGHEGRQLGCVNISGMRLTDWEKGRTPERETFILFTGREGWRRAWRIARLLQHSHRARPAQLHSADIHGLSIQLGAPHALKLNQSLYCTR
jgi:hypothetical protein